MGKGKITKRSVDALEPSAAQNGAVQLWDTEIIGFGVRTYCSGRKVYVYKYAFDGQAKFVTIGAHGAFSPDAARMRAFDLAHKVASGEDPASKKRAARPSMTVSALIDHYFAEGPITRPNKRTSSWSTDWSRLNRHVRPLLGSKPANKVTRSDVEAMQHDIASGKTARIEKTGKKHGKAIVEGGTTPGSNAIVCLSAMYSWAIAQNILQTNPCIGVQKFKRRKRQRFFTEEERLALLRTLDELEASGRIDPARIDAIRLLYLTGARKNEILGLKWSEVSFERRIILLPSERAKNGFAGGIPLSAPALAILKKRPNDSGFVFPNPASAKGHIADISAAWRHITRCAGLKGVRIHDLRHNFGSTAVGLNISLRLTGAMLQHKSAQSTEIYAHVAPSAAHEASERTAAELMRGYNEG